MHAIGQMVSSFWSIHQKWPLLLQKGEGQRDRERLSAGAADAIAKTCLNTAPVAQRATPAGFVTMTTRWAERFPGGTKYTHRHSDWGQPIQEGRHPCDYSSFVLWVHRDRLQPHVHFVNPSFPLKSADHLAFETTWEEQNLPIWELHVTQSLPVTSTFLASLTELCQEIPSTRLPVSWTTHKAIFQL